MTKKEWENEPDELSWDYVIDGETYRCEIKRSHPNRSLCGYVRLKGCDIDHNDYLDDLDIEVHGGITFSRKYKGDHVIGFDCAHAGDLMPGLMDMGVAFDGDTYKNIDFVKAECEALAQQLHKAKPSLRNRRKGKVA